MRKRILIDKLRLGMFIDGMDASWFKTPFLKHRFIIKTQDQLDKIRESGVDAVFIDTKKGLDVVDDPTDSDLKPQIEPSTLPISSPVERGSVAVEEKQTTKQEERFNEYVKIKEGLLSIDSTSLLSGSMIDFSLYVKNGITIKPLVEYKGNDILLTGKMLSSSHELLIEKKDSPKFKSYLKEVIRGGAGGLSTQQAKNITVKENAKIIVQELLSNPSRSEKVQECKVAVEDIMATIMDSKGFITNLLTINKNDYYTYTHSVNSSVFSVATAISIGLFSEGDLFGLGLGSLLHDIGKTTIPPEILNKPEDRLTDFESKLLKEHVIEGVNILNLYKCIPEGTIYPILEHHEKLSGTGYPNGLTGDKMHLTGKILSITNFYDRLTTSHAYFKGLSPFEALSYIRNSSQEYDLDIFKEFIKILGKSP
ncbi:MAG: DUF3391 domain-containing protein [Nitrospirae bacterium]|nr:DUF3391 domain-containing protein [Nitrospirota bacterium]